MVEVQYTPSPILNSEGPWMFGGSTGWDPREVVQFPGRDCVRVSWCAPSETCFLKRLSKLSMGSVAGNLIPKPLFDSC